MASRGTTPPDLTPPRPHHHAEVPVGLCAAGAFIADKDMKGIAAGLRDPAKQQQSKIARIVGAVGAGLGLLLFVLFVILLVVRV